MASDEASNSWFLHSQGRRYGPLSEDEIRGYFRAGMVKAGDLITMPARADNVSAADVAALLGESPPPPAPAPAPPVIQPMSSIPNVSSTPGLGPNALPGGGLPPFPMMPMASERPSFGWVAPVVGIAVMSIALYIGLSFLRKMQVVRLHPAQVAAEPVLVPGNAAPGNSPAPIVAAPANPTPSPPVGSMTPEAWLNKADQLSKASDWAALVEHSRQWSVAEPLRDMPWIFLGIANARLGQDAQAIEALNRVLPTQPNYPASRSALADVYLHAGQYQTSANILEELIRSNPEDARLWNNLGNAYFGIERYADSIKALETAVKLRPDSREAWSNLGNAYQRSGNPESAAQAYARAKAAE